jgi:O-antigen/teichoic acid export membrane protein
LWIAVLLLNNVNQALVTFPMVTFRTLQVNPNQYTFAVAILQGLLLPIYTLLLFIAKILAFPLFHIELNNTTIYAFVSMALGYQIYEFLRKSYFSDQKFKNALFLDLGTISIQIIALLFLYISDRMELQNILLALSASYILSFVLVCCNASPLNLKVIVHTFRKHWQFGSWLLATSTIQWLSGNFVFLFTGSIVGNAAVGILKIGQSLVGAITFLFQVVENYLPPKASAIYQKSDMEGLWSEMQLTMRKLGVLVILFATLIAALAYPMASWLFSDEVANYYHIYQGFALCAILFFPTFIYRIGFRTIEKNHFIFMAFSIHIILSALLSILLIPNEGLEGAIWTMILAKTGMVVFYVITFHIQRKSNINPDRIYLSK